MKITTINYQRTFALAPYQNERLGVEIELSEGDSVEAAFALAKITVDNFKSEPLVSQIQTIPPPQEDSTPKSSSNLPKVPVNKREQQIQQHIKDIQSVTEEKVLKDCYEFLSKNYPEIREAYETKLKELQ